MHFFLRYRQTDYCKEITKSNPSKQIVKPATVPKHIVQVQSSVFPKWLCKIGWCANRAVFFHVVRSRVVVHTCGWCNWTRSSLSSHIQPHKQHQQQLQQLEKQHPQLLNQRKQKVAQFWQQLQRNTKYMKKPTWWNDNFTHNFAQQHAQQLQQRKLTNQQHQQWNEQLRSKMRKAWTTMIKETYCLGLKSIKCAKLLKISNTCLDVHAFSIALQKSHFQQACCWS